MKNFVGKKKKRDFFFFQISGCGPSWKLLKFSICRKCSFCLLLGVQTMGLLFVLCGIYLMGEMNYKMVC